MNSTLSKDANLGVRHSKKKKKNTTHKLLTCVFHQQSSNRFKAEPHALTQSGLKISRYQKACKELKMISQFKVYVAVTTLTLREWFFRDDYLNNNRK